MASDRFSDSFGKPGSHRNALPADRKKPLLDELESLNDMLSPDDEQEADGLLEDLPVIKSFVEDVPILQDRLSEHNDTSVPPTAGTTTATNNTSSAATSDHRFLDDDPLAISEAVRARQKGQPAPEPTPPEPATPPAQRRFSSPRPTGENPFLPKSAMDKLRDAKEDSASAQLRDLLRKPSKLPTFNSDPNSAEYKALRQKATQLVSEIVKAHLPKIEAELRMRLETEVDAMFKSLRDQQR